MSGLAYLFHCTEMKNLDSIMKHGLVPGWGTIQSKGMFSYFCKADMVGWAMAHIAVRHHCAVESLAVIRFRFVPKVYTKFFSSGIYRTALVLDCSYISYRTSTKVLTMIEYGQTLIESDSFPLIKTTLDEF